MPYDDWRLMDRATRSTAYDNRAAVPETASYLTRWTTLSTQLRDTHPGELDLVYGPAPRNRIDLFPCGAADAALLVFIHGGYWQRNAKEDFACVAIGPLARGLDVALVGYTLAPEASLSTIAAEIRAALVFLRRHDAARGVTRRMIVSGWSAGGHLAALAMDWPEADAALAISGIYDLAPLRDTVLDDALRLSDSEIADLSPIRRPTRRPMTIAYGARELPELCRQSRDYHAACAAAAGSTRLSAVDGANHFSILDGLIEPDGVLTRMAVDLAAS